MNPNENKHTRLEVFSSRKNFLGQKIQNSFLVFLFITILFILTSPNVSTAQDSDKNERIFRYLWSDSPKLTAQDIQDLTFLDKCSNQAHLGIEDFEKIGDIISRSDLDFVVRHALMTLPSHQDFPQKVLTNIVKLAYLKNDSFYEDLAVVLGRLAVPSTFPTLLYLLWHSEGYLNPASVVYKFGVESLAALPELFSRMTICNVKTVSDINYIGNVFLFLLNLTASGQSVVIPCQPHVEEIELLSIKDRQPILPDLKRRIEDWAIGLKEHAKSKKSFSMTKRFYQTFSLPPGKTDELCSGVKFREASLSSALRTLFGLIDVEVTFGQGDFEIIISCEIVGESYGEVADKIMINHGLIGQVKKDMILIQRKDE